MGVYITGVRVYIPPRTVASGHPHTLTPHYPLPLTHHLHYYTHTYTHRYTSFMAPDLWLSSMASGWIDVVKANTPLSFGVNTVKAQEEEKKDYSRRQSMHKYHSMRTNNTTQTSTLKKFSIISGMKALDTSLVDESHDSKNNTNMDFQQTYQPGDSPKTPDRSSGGFGRILDKAGPISRGKGGFFNSEKTSDKDISDKDASDRSGDKSDESDKSATKDTKDIHLSLKDEEDEEGTDEEEEGQGKTEKVVIPHARQFANGFKVVSRGTCTGL